MTYKYDIDRGIWMRPGFDGLDYSDGESSEQHLRDTIAHAGRLDTFSEELRRGIKDWPSEYHLSRKRHCVLRPIGLKPGESVLELGSGCGAISRYLGETGADVTAVEGSPIRAAIGAARCRGLTNVQVYCDDLRSFESDRRYDWVLLIGVLEYASMFASSSGGPASYLARIVRYLKPTGKMVVAIENKLGLKYFNGCSEDHLGKAFYGIQGLYRSGEPTTYGRRELKELLAGAGLSSVSFLYPFPDYKLPSVVIGDAAMTHADFNVPDLLMRDLSRDYGGSRWRVFSEALVAKQLHANGVLQDLSNSLIAIGGTSHWRPESKILAWTFAVDRYEPFCTQTVFTDTDDGVVVRKESLCTPAGSAVVSCGAFIHHTTDSAYAAGSLLIVRLLEVAAREEGVGHLCDALEPWFQLLLRNCSGQPFIGNAYGQFKTNLEVLELPGRYFDCTPFNLIETEAGLVEIDDEWRVDGTIPLGVVLTRGVYWSLYWPLQRSSKRLVSDIIFELARRHGLAIQQQSIDRWREAEGKFQAWAQGRPSAVLPEIPDNGLISIFENDADSISAHLRGAKAEDLKHQYDQLLRGYEGALWQAGSAGAAKDNKVERIVAKIENSELRASPELPVNFNPIRYIFLHPDLFEAEVDPFQHYLTFGRREGRGWT